MKQMCIRDREHVRRFHELFFTLSPEKSAIEHNVKRALLLADKSVDVYKRQECGNEPLLVIRALQYGKDGALRHVGEFPVLDFRF